MQYNVAQLLKESIGASRIHDVDDDVSSLEGATKWAKGQVRLLRTDKGIWVSADLVCDIPSTCSRCLSNFDFALHITIEEEYLPTIDVNTGERIVYGNSEEDPFFIDSQHILDLREALRQYEVASMPIKPLCREDCAGLCPMCGTDLNEGRCECTSEILDPRWETLLKLKVGGSR